MTLNEIAQVIGYVVIFTGAGLLCALILGIAGRIILEWYWRRQADVRFLREFIEWKRGRYPG